jgi:hypothetical protein
MGSALNHSIRFATDRLQPAPHAPGDIQGEEQQRQRNQDIEKQIKRASQPRICAVSKSRNRNQVVKDRAEDHDQGHKLLPSVLHQQVESKATGENSCPDKQSRLSAVKTKHD